MKLSRFRSQPGRNLAARHVDRQHGMMARLQGVDQPDIEQFGPAERITADDVDRCDHKFPPGMTVARPRETRS